MNGSKRAVVLGGGLAGMAAAWSVAHNGMETTIVEAGPSLGGLAGTFEHQGSFYPLAYHHILHRDRVLLWFLDRMGALDAVRWRRIRLLFHLDDRFWNLAHPVDFLRFPMSFPDKLRFAALMLRCFRKDDWGDWNDRSAAELIDRWAGPGVRRTIFERLSRLKFELPCDKVSAAWLGARLHFREGSSALGYIPGTNWTKVLCEGLRGMLADAGVRLVLGRKITRLIVKQGRIVAAECDDGTELPGDAFVSALPTEVYRTLVPEDPTPDLLSIRYTAILSGVCATRQTIDTDFYWMNLATLQQSACGIFRLESLNPSIGAPGETCLNFVTHVPHRTDAAYARTDDEIWDGYRRDFEQVFGFPLETQWTKLMRLPLYSPVFHTGYRNPPVRSARWPSLYFAGNYRTFPSIASTGTALDSGLEAAAALLDDLGRPSALLESAHRFHLKSQPRV